MDNYLIHIINYLANHKTIFQLIFLLLPLLISFLIFGTGFIFCKVLRLKQRFTKKVFILIAIFIYLSSSIFIYSTVSEQKNYSTGNQVTEAVALAARLRPGLQEWHHKHGSFENIKITDISNQIEGKYVENIWLSIPDNVDNKTIVIYVKMRSSNEIDDAIKGKVYTLETLDGGNTWSCGENAKNRHKNHIDKEYLPGMCKYK